MNYLKIDVHSQEITILLENATEYRKIALVKARPSEDGEKLDTVLADGTIETSRILTSGLMVITNPSGEEYAIENAKFHALYEEDSTGNWVSKGRIRAILNPVNAPIEIMTPWGEPQYGNELCFIAQGATAEDRYLIGQDEFYETYSVAGD